MICSCQPRRLMLKCPSGRGEVFPVTGDAARRSARSARTKPENRMIRGLAASRPDGSTGPDFRLFPLFCALFFPLLPIAFAPPAFLSPCQSLALQTAPHFHCRSIVFWFGPAWGAGGVQQLAKLQNEPNWDNSNDFSTVSAAAERSDRARRPVDARPSRPARIVRALARDRHVMHVALA
jgi:hypothetical protein